jgi:hypothetical protein
MSEASIDETTEIPPGDGAGSTLYDPEGASAAQFRSGLSGTPGPLPGAAPPPAPQPTPPTKPKRRPGPWIAAAVVALLVFVALGIGVALLTDEPPPPPPSFDLALRTEPVDARIDLDGAFVSAGVVLRQLPKDGRPHALRVYAPGYVTRTITFVDRSPGELVMLDPLPSVAPVIAPPAPRTGGAAEPMEQARVCMRSGLPQESINRCVVGALRGSATSEPEMRLLCVTYRSMADRANAVSCMRRYVQRYPSTRYTDQFREYINGE